MQVCAAIWLLLTTGLQYPNPQVNIYIIQPDHKFGLISSLSNVRAGFLLQQPQTHSSDFCSQKTATLIDSFRHEAFFWPFKAKNLRIFMTLKVIIDE